MVRKLVNISTGAFLFGVVACTEPNTAGITEDGNPIAELSSSSISSPGSSGSISYKFDLWNGASGAARVNVGNNAGFWYSVDDEEEGGSSSIKFPVSDENVDSPEYMESVVSYCSGLCGTVELGEGSTAPSAGVGIALAEKDSTIDISEWDGLCISYESELSMKGLLGYKDGSAKVSAVDLPSIIFDKTQKGSAAARCAKWEEFKPDSKDTNSGSEASKKATTLIFKFFGKAKESGFFNIHGVSSYKHGVENLDSVEIVDNPKVETTGCLWNGTADDLNELANTGFGGGFWFTYTDEPVGGSSSFAWKSGSPDKYMSSSEWIAAVAGASGGISATASFDNGGLNGAGYAGVGLQIVGIDEETGVYYPKAGDITSWEGLCVTYVSEIDMKVLVADSTSEIGAVLPMSTEPVENCVSWSEMGDENGLTRRAEAIKFEWRSSEKTQAKFNIIAVSTQSVKDACSIDLSKVTSF